MFYVIVPSLFEVDTTISYGLIHLNDFCLSVVNTLQVG